VSQRASPDDGRPPDQSTLELPKDEDPLLGQLLGDYRVEERIGAGAMGVVYRAVQPLIGKHVAVKVLQPDAARSESEVQRLLLEARTVNNIGHRGVIDVFGFGQTPDGRQYFLMEHLSGQPLDRLIAQRAPLPPQEAIGILDELLDALGAIHQAGVVHRDLKPSNIYLVAQRDRPPFVKILDFGIAKIVMGDAPGDASTPAAGGAVQTTIAGTPEFMAPELVRGGLLSARSDLYAVGVTAFQMLTGLLPFRSKSVNDCMEQHVNAPVPAPSSEEPTVPRELDRWVMQLMAKLPEARPPSAEVARRELKQVRENLSTVVAKRPVTLRLRTRVALAAVAVAGGLLMLRSAAFTERPEPLIVDPPPRPAPPWFEPAAPPLMGEARAMVPVAARAPRKKPDVGTLTIKAKQYSTSFKIDGHEWGGQPAGRTVEGIRAGTHHVVVLQNQKRFERDVTVEPGGTAVVEVVFK
jgi:serine/threonine-protein kinase